MQIIKNLAIINHINFFLKLFKLLVRHGRPLIMPNLPIFGIFSNFQSLTSQCWGQLQDFTLKYANNQEFGHNQPHYFFLKSFKLLVGHGRPLIMPDLPVFRIFANFQSLTPQCWGQLQNFTLKNANNQEFGHNQPHYFFKKLFKLLVGHGRPLIMPD